MQPVLSVPDLQTRDVILDPYDMMHSIDSYSYLHSPGIALVSRWYFPGTIIIDSSVIGESLLM